MQYAAQVRIATLKEKIMEYSQFLNQVQQQGQLNSMDEAEDAARTTFEVLARRLPGSEAAQLVPHLPPELAQYFSEESTSPAEPFSLDEFFQRVNQDQGVDMPTASLHVRAVMDVLRESLTPEQFERLRSQLPGEFNSLFDTGGEETATQNS
jgi:uncharacterized protein (DUF2267 family)